MNTVKGIFSHKSDEWATPKRVFDDLDHEFHFTLDAASTDENALCEKHLCKDIFGGGADPFLAGRTSVV